MNLAKNLDTQSPLQKICFHTKKMSSPLKINLAKTLKNDKSLLPRRCSQTKLVNDSMEADKFKIALIMPKFQRNTSISKLKK